MELKQRAIIHFLFKEGVKGQDIHKQLSAQFADVAENLRSVRPWCQSVRQERHCMHDQPRSGRPPIDFLDIKILFTLEKYPFHSASSLAEILKMSYKTMLNHYAAYFT
jgi:hypothetical protein